MKQFTLSANTNTGYTSVSNIFIDNYMPHASGEFIKIYLHLLRCVNNTQSKLSISTLADTFNQTEADVMRALKYWNKVGVISLDFNGPQNSLGNITFCDLNDTANRNNQTIKEPVSTHIDNVSSESISSESDIDDDITPILIDRKTTFPEKPNYSAEEISTFSTQDDLKFLLYVASTYMGKPLSSSEASTIIYFYDTLKFPADLIEYLLEYCIQRSHKNMRYIETIALDWAASGIKTVKAAKEEILNHNETTYSIMNAFGISNRNPGQHEKELISKWTDVYCFSSDMIIEACNRTIKATHQPSFEYADSILTKWNSANVRTTSDIRKADSEYEATKKGTKSVVTNKINRFNNFQQRNSDDDDLESALLSNNG